MIELYTDGSCRDNRKGKGIGAYGFIVYRDGKQIHQDCHSSTESTNNRMEMLGVISALQWLIDNSVGAATIYMDSNLCYRGITEWMPGWKARGWKKADKSEVLNRDLWEQIDSLIREVPFVSFAKTKGHADDARNNAVDAMVQAASLKLKKEIENK